MMGAQQTGGHGAAEAPSLVGRPRRALARCGVDGLVLLLLAGLFLATIPLVGPGGEFPLNDDWSFVRSTRTLVVAQAWRPLGWAGMTQISHALIGYAVCSLSACTFEHLRWASLLAGLALLLSTFALLRSIGASRSAAAFGAVAAVFNPIVYPLLYTFMTDGVFALLLVMAAAAAIAVVRRGRWRDVVLATVLLVVATLSRQLALTMAAALLPVYLLSSRERLRIRLGKAGMPLAVCLGVLLLYEHWMRRTGRLPALYDSKPAELIAGLAAPGHLLSHAVLDLLLSSTYLGLVCLPVLLLAPLGGPRQGRAALLRGPAGRWATILVAAMLLSMGLNRSIMPLLGNVLGKSGVGPLTLRDTYVLGLPNVPDLPVAFWAAVTGLSLLGLWLLVFRTVSLVAEAWPDVRAGRLAPPMAIRLFGILTTALYLLPLLPGEVYDRYVVVVAPILCIGLLPPRRRGGRDLPMGVPLSITASLSGPRHAGIPQQREAIALRAAAFACAAGLALVSILATHDYLAWNRARWEAIDGVEAAHEADATTMDGGFEYNGYRSYDRLYVPTPAKSWWWVADDAITIGFGGMPGTDVLRRYAYRTWLPPDTRFIAVLRRTPPPHPP